MSQSQGTDKRLSATQSLDTTMCPKRMFETEPSEDARDRSDFECFQQLLDQGIPGVFNEADLEIRIAKTASVRGPRVLQLLFERANAANCLVPDVSPAMVLAATRNALFGHTLLPFLEEKAKDKTWFYQDEVLTTAAAHGSVRTISFLLSKRPEVKDSEKFRIAVTANPDHIVTEFLYRTVEPASIGLAELEAAARNSDDTLECVVDRLGNMRLPVGSPTLGETIARNCRRSKNLLEALEKGLAMEPRTETEVRELVHAAIQNQRGLTMATFLLKRYQLSDKRIEISPGLLEAAASNPTQAPEMLRLLLNECDDRRVKSVITVGVLSMAAVNGGEAPEALRMLFMELDGPLNESDSQAVFSAIEQNHNWSAEEAVEYPQQPSMRKKGGERGVYF
ncbi:hypothetical protein VTH82DRAFT_7826 [Thermothelomyces myriococcoides]